MAPDLVAVHAEFASSAEVVAERRSLYQLIAELVGAEGALSDDVLDSPLVRYSLGGALGGHLPLEGRDLVVFRDALGTTADAGVPVVADPVARVALAELLRIVGPVDGLRLITMADEEFDDVRDVVDRGVRLVRETGGVLAADLLEHVELVAVVDPASAGGLVSASSRYFPGLVVIRRPSSADEVAEALIHEGAHEKFFDLAITRRFLNANSDSAPNFTPSWSSAKWPFEQVFAAWHAYLCLAQFYRDSNGLHIGSDSLLPVAAERAAEIGQWLRKHETYLLSDGRRMLDVVQGSLESGGFETLPPESKALNGCYVANPRLRSSVVTRSGRRVVGLTGSPPELFWLENDSATALAMFVGRADGVKVEGDVVDGTKLSSAEEQDALVALVINELIVPADSGG